MLKNTLISIAFILFTCHLFAQSNTASPYSFYGIGEQKSALTISQRATGGIQNLTIDNNISLLNPAMGAGMSETSFQLGFTSSSVNIQSVDNSHRENFTNLSYLMISVPVTSKIAFNFGLLPFSSVNYESRTESFESDAVTLDETTTLSGEGGTSKVFLAAGYEPLKNLKIGIQGGYVFGNVKNTESVVSTDSNVLPTLYEHNNRLGGFSLISGIHYDKEFENEWIVKYGMSVEHQQKLDANIQKKLASLNSSREVQVIRDEQSKGSFEIPTTFSAGIGIGKKKKWFVGTDFSTRDKIDISADFYKANTNESYTSYSKFSIGGFYTPKRRGQTNFWRKITYRMGARFINTGLQVDANNDGLNFEEIKDNAFTFGFGLPVGRKSSNLDLGFEIGQRGSTDNGMIEENYFNAMVGITLNDRWFKKREIF